MLLRKLLQIRKADAELPKEIRAALIESLFAPIASLIVGAVACSIVGAAVALRVGDHWIMESLELSGLSALEKVKAGGRASSALGEGLADALNVGGY